MKKKPNRILMSSLIMTTLCVTALALIATLPGGGWWFGAQVQNVSSNNAGVSFAVYDYASGSTSFFRFDTISPGAYKLYQPTNFPGMPDNFQGSSIASSNQDIRAIVNLTNRFAGGLGDPNSPSPAAGQYQGAITAGTTLVFPLAKNNYYGKTITYIIQNAGSTATTVYADFNFQNAHYYYYSASISPHQIVMFDAVDARSNSGNHVPVGKTSAAVGSLTVTASQNLAGIALEHNTEEDHATLLQATRGFTTNDYDTIVYAPINKNNYYNRFTGLQVQNVSSNPVTVNVTYVTQAGGSCPGGTIHEDPISVAPHASYTFVQPNTTHLPVGCFGSATVKATGGNVVAVVNEAFMPPWLNANPGHANEATAYNAIPNKFATTKLSVPLYKEDSYSKDTAISIENVGAAPATNVVITLKGPTGTYTSNPLSIDTGAAYVAMDLRFKPISFWKNGIAPTPTVLGCQNTTTGCGANGLFSVSVTSDQNIVGVTNESTYPITAPRINQDKSNYEAFNLTP